MGLLDGIHGGHGGHGAHGGLALVLIALLVVVILILVAGRKDEDPAGTRTQARYLGAITVVAVFVALLAFFGMVHALTDLIVDKAPRAGGGGLPKALRDILDQIPGVGRIPGLGGGHGPHGGGGRSDDADYRMAARAGLLGIAALAVFVFNIRRARTLVPADAFPEQATGRVARAALYGACFVASIIVILAATKGFYGLFKIICPGTFGSGDNDVVRQQGISEMISFAFLGLGAAFIFVRSWYWLPEHRSST